MSMARVSGVYAITNTVTGEQYVGSTVDIRGRWSGHRSALIRGRHGNTLLQDHWRRYGSRAFRHSLLESITDRGLLAEQERTWSDRLRPTYNRSRIFRANNRPLSLVQLPHLRAWRLKSERTQFDVAREAGVGMSTVTRAEKGDYITALNAQKIARALGVSVRQLQEEKVP